MRPSRRAGAGLVVGGAVLATLTSLTAPVGVTYASWSDSAIVPAEVAAGLPELDRQPPGAGRLTVASLTRFRLGDGELVGDALLWDGKVRLSSEAQPGFMISAWAEYGDLVA